MKHWCSLISPITCVFHVHCPVCFCPSLTNCHTLRNTECNLWCVCRAYALCLMMSQFIPSTCMSFIFLRIVEILHVFFTYFTVFTVFRLLTDFICFYNYDFWLSLCKIVRSSVILLLPLFTPFLCYFFFLYN